MRTRARHVNQNVHLGLERLRIGYCDCPAEHDVRIVLVTPSSNVGYLVIPYPETRTLCVSLCMTHTAEPLSIFLQEQGRMRSGPNLIRE